MKKNDITTSLGLLFGIGLTIWGMSSGKSGLGIFWHAPSLAITMGGSFSALLINYPISQIKNMFKVIAQSFKNKSKSGIEIIENFITLSRKARREGLLSLEDEISDIEDNFMKKGLQMVVDGIEPEVIENIMELEIGEMERRHSNSATVLKSWAAYAPAFGMIGTLIGLVQMLANLSDQSTLASGMAVALITTFYGSVLANLFLIPLASNLTYKSNLEAVNKEMMLEGILAIQSGVNPRIIEEKLTSYLSPNEKLDYKKVSNYNEVIENV